MNKRAMKKIMKIGRVKFNALHKKGAFGALTLLVLVGAAFSLGNAHAIFYQGVQLDGGGGGDYDARARDLPGDTVPPNTPPNTDVQVTTQYVNANGTVAGRYAYNTQLSTTLWYAWNRGSLPSSDSSTVGWATALTDPNITIGYDYNIYDSQGNVIEPGSTVPSGSAITLKFNPYTSDNIYWFGTGTSMDSPWGEWRAGAAAPARSGNRVTCDSKDLVQQYTYTTYNAAYTFDVYIPFVVNPPARSLGNLTGLSCGPLTANGDGSASASCTVTANNGSVSPTFNYTATNGKFYYRYYDQRDMTSIGWGGPGCYGNNIPLTTAYGSASGPTSNNDTNIQSAYVLNIPQQSLAYPLTVAAGNTPPGAPTLSCAPSPTTTGTNVSVTLTATDPDGDNVQYGVDWLATGSVNSGWTSPVASGVSQTLTKMGGYPAPGTYTVTGWAQDINGAQSAPATCSFTVSQLSPELGAGPITPTTATVGTQVTLRSTITNSGSASTGTGFWNLFQRATDVNGANATDIGKDDSPALNGGSTDIATLPYSFPSAGTWYVRACADKSSAGDGGQITETDDTNNCGGWTRVDVSAPPPTGVLSCAVDNQNPTPGTTVTYTVTPSGNASGPYTWNDTQGGSYGNGTTASRLITTLGSYVMNVSGQNVVTQPVSCPLVTGGCGTPSGTITANPDRVRAGQTSTLSWSATGVNGSCTITGPGVNQTATANSCSVSPGSITTPAITAQSVYTLTCGGTQVGQAIVNIIPGFEEF